MKRLFIIAALAMFMGNESWAQSYDGVTGSSQQEQTSKKKGEETKDNATSERDQSTSFGLSSESNVANGKSEKSALSEDSCKPTGEQDYTGQSQAPAAESRQDNKVTEVRSENGDSQCEQKKAECKDKTEATQQLSEGQCKQDESPTCPSNAECQDKKGPME